MSTTHHDPHAFGAPLTSAEVNRTLGELDAAIESVIATGSGVSTTLSSTAAGGQATLIVVSSAGFAPGNPIYIVNANGSFYESRIVATVPDGTHITVTVNLTNSYDPNSAVSKSPIEIVDARAGATTLKARLDILGGRVFNVKDYGAIGDGVANDSTAIQAAINAAKAVQGTVFLPPGLYLIGTTTLYLTTTGATGGDPVSIKIIGAGTEASTIRYTGSGTAISSGTTINGGESIVIEDLTIIGNGSTGSARGLHLKRYWHASSIRNVRIESFAGTGLHLHRCFALVVDSCTILNNGGYGVRFDNNNAGTIQNSRINLNALGGVWAGYSDSVTGDFDEIGTAQAGGSIIASNIQDNAGPGITFNRVSDGFLVAGCFIEANMPTGNAQVIISGTASVSSTGVTLLGNNIRSNGVSDVGIYMDRCADACIVGNVTRNHSDRGIRATANATFHLGQHRFFSETGLDDASTSNGTSFAGRTVPFTYTFQLDNLAASITDGALPVAGAPAFSRWAMAANWEILHMSARVSAAPAAGTITIYPSAQTTGLTGLSLVFDSVAATFQAIAGRVKGTSAQTSGCMYTTSGTLSPTTIDIVVTISGILKVGL